MAGLIPPALNLRTVRGFATLHVKNCLLTKEDTINGPYLPDEFNAEKIGTVLAFAIFAAFLITQKQNPIDVYKAIIFCYVGNKYNVGEIWVHMTPILICSIAALVPAKVGLSNCGGEGQLIAGALAANVTGVYIFRNLPSAVGLPLIFLSGILAGMIGGFIPLSGKMTLNMNETLTTLLMNYLVVKLVAFLVYGPIKDPAGNNYPMSPKLPEQLKITPFSGTRGNYTIIIAVIIAVVVWYIFNKTELGFKMRVVGGNNRAAEFAGYKVRNIQCVSFLLASGINGIPFSRNSK